MSEPSLDEVLSEDYTPEDSDTGEVQEVEAEAQDTPEPESAPPAEPSTDEKRIDPDQFKGYLDEREKRQKLENEIEQMRKQLESKQEPAPKIDPVDDPDGFNDQVEQRIRQATFEQDLKWMRRTHSDFDKAEAWINEQLGSNVAMQAKLSNSDSLLDDAYQMYQDHLKLEQLSDVDALREQIRAELKEELMGEVKGEAEAVSKEQTAKTAAVQKPSLAETGNSGGVATEGMLSLEDMLGSDFNHRPR